MDLEFLKRVRKTSLVTGLVLFPVISTYFGLLHGVGWLFGCVWSIVNLHFIGVLVGAVLTYPKRSYSRISLVFLVKFPFLYGVAFVFLHTGMFSVQSVLAGFLWPLTIIVLKALGRIALGLDKGARERVEAAPGITGKGA